MKGGGQGHAGYGVGQGAIEPRSARCISQLRPAFQRHKGCTRFLQSRRKCAKIDVRRILAEELGFKGFPCQSH